MRRLRAISIKQPFAEQIMRGTKRFECRSRPTDIRGRVYVYASLKPRPRSDWTGTRLRPDLLPRGLIVGTVEVIGSRREGPAVYAWALKSPRRLRKPIKPRAHPQPVWFYPFGK